MSIFIVFCLILQVLEASLQFGIYIGHPGILAQLKFGRIDIGLYRADAHKKLESSSYAEFLIDLTRVTECDFSPSGSAHIEI